MVQLIQEWIAGFFNILWRLISGYGTFGLPFALAHVVVLEQIIYRTWYRKILPETKALEQWVPFGNTQREQPAMATPDANVTPASNSYEKVASDADGSETTRFLDQFVEECERLGEQGLFVPMTDFSDRLDSVLDGLVAELHDRINLFILVGVAGTLLGIFEFSFNSYDVLKNTAMEPGERLLKLGEFLSGSMAKAFPVSFIGLVLTFFAQVIASKPERRLRTALAGAIGKALEVRKAKSRSQAQLVEQSVESMKEAMRPLENLQEAITTVVGHIVKDLGERLEQSLNLVREQFNELQKTNATTQQVVYAVNTAVQTLQNIVNGLTNQIEQTRQVLDNVIEHQDEQKDSLREFNQVIKANLEQVHLINRSIVNAVQAVEEMPLKVQLAVQVAAHEVTQDMLSIWRGTSDEIKELVVYDSEHLLDDVAEQARNVENSLLNASTNLSALAEGTQTSLGGLLSLPKDLMAEIKGTFSILSKGSLTTWEVMSQEFMNGMQRQYLQYWGDIRIETESVRDALQRSAEKLEDISKNMDSILKESIAATLHATKEELMESWRNWNQVLAERYPQVAQDVLSLSASLKDNIAQVSQIQQESDAWLKNVQGAQQTMSEMHALLLSNLEKIHEQRAQEEQARAEKAHEERASEEKAREEKAREEAIREEAAKTEQPATDQTNALLQQNVDELKRLNESIGEIWKRIPASDEAVQKKVQKSTQPLTNIRDDHKQKPPEPEPEPEPEQVEKTDGFFSRVLKKLPWPRRRNK